MRSLFLFIALVPSLALAQTKPKDPVPPAKKPVVEPEYPLDLERVGLTFYRGQR
jgi:hypothetical protein